MSNNEQTVQNSEEILNYYENSIESAPAFEYCSNIIIEGYDDWYVPARTEAVIASRIVNITSEIGLAQKAPHLCQKQLLNLQAFQVLHMPISKAL